MKKISLNHLKLKESMLLSLDEKKEILGGNGASCGGEWIECPGSVGYCVMDESECYDSYPPPGGGSGSGGDTDPKCEEGGSGPGYPIGCY